MWHVSNFFEQHHSSSMMNTIASVRSLPMYMTSPRQVWVEQLWFASIDLSCIWNEFWAELMSGDKLKFCISRMIRIATSLFQISLSTPEPYLVVCESQGNGRADVLAFDRRMCCDPRREQFQWCFYILDCSFCSDPILMHTCTVVDATCCVGCVFAHCSRKK